MSRESCVLVGMIVSPVRWHVANSTRGGSFSVYVIQGEGRFAGEEGFCVLLLLGVENSGAVEGG